MREDFSEFYKKYEKLMYNIANDILKDSYEAEDAVQIAFINMYKRFEGLGDIASARTRHFVVTVIRRVAIDIYRKRQKQSMRQAFFEDVGRIDRSVQWDALAGKNEVMECIKKLPKIYADALILKYVQGYASKEIAELFGKPHGTVQARIFKGRKLLREELKKNGIVIKI